MEGNRTLGGSAVAKSILIAAYLGLSYRIVVIFRGIGL